MAQRTAQLEHRARQLQKLTLDLSEAEDQERRRLADILHDDLQQVLAGAKFHLGLMKNRVTQDPPLRALAAQIEQMLKDAIGKSRSLSHELSPVIMRHEDFAETLQWLGSQVQAKHGLTVHVHAHGRPTAIGCAQSFSLQDRPGVAVQCGQARAGRSGHHPGPAAGPMYVSVCP